MKLFYTRNSYTRNIKTTGTVVYLIFRYRSLAEWVISTVGVQPHVHVQPPIYIYRCRAQTSVATSEYCNTFCVSLSESSQQYIYTNIVYVRSCGS